MTKISGHFTLEEMCASATANAKNIPNKPTIQQIINMVYLCANVLEPLRLAMNTAIKIGSGYRSARLNKAVGGVSNSQHMSGEAADICIDGDMEKGRKWFNWIKNNCDFDQLIWEHNAKGSYWIHVSYCHCRKNRRQVIQDLAKK